MNQSKTLQELNEGEKIFDSTLLFLTDTLGVYQDVFRPDWSVPTPTDLSQ